MISNQYETVTMRPT